MKASSFPGGILLLAALPLLSQTPRPPETRKTQDILRFTLNESPAQIVRLMGRPGLIDDSLSGYQSWQYESQTDDRDDNSPPNWFVCLRAGDRQILSVTRNFDTPQDVDDLFPASQTTVHHWPSKHTAQFSLRLRRLSGEALLLAMGTARPGERTTQLVLIRRSALKTFMPWLAEQIQ